MREEKKKKVRPVDPPSENVEKRERFYAHEPDAGGIFLFPIDRERSP